MTFKAYHAGVLFKEFGEFTGVRPVTCSTVQLINGRMDKISIDKAGGHVNMTIQTQFFEGTPKKTFILRTMGIVTDKARPGYRRAMFMSATDFIMTLETKCGLAGNQAEVIALSSWMLAVILLMTTFTLPLLDGLMLNFLLSDAGMTGRSDT